MFRHKSFWIILIITTIVWLMATMSEHDDYPLDVPLQWSGYDASSYVATSADTVLPVVVNSNCFQAIARHYIVQRTPYVIHTSSDTVIKVNSVLLGDVVKQMGFVGTHGISSPAESLHLTLTSRVRKAYVPRLHDVTFHFSDQRGLSGTPVIEPDTVWLFGDPEKMDKITEIVTKPTEINDIRDSGWHTLALEPVWREYSNVHSTTDSIRIFLPVEQYVEKTIMVNVTPQSPDSRVKLRVIPERVNVTLWVPVNSYDLLTTGQVEAEVTYNSDDKSGELPVRITRFPDNTRVKAVSPSSLQYVIIKN